MTTTTAASKNHPNQLRSSKEDEAFWGLWLENIAEGKN
jgi:hypothetical protein